jgi:hypothetical protein
MANRTGNYTAFYVKEPFNQNNLGAHSARDFNSYNLLKAWKGKGSSFPFVDSHDKNYNVRDGSSWESTLKPRLRDRLNKSKNIILFLSEHTSNSQALREELDFGINNNGLPVIVIYPDFKEKSDIINCQSKTIKQQVKNLWGNVPVFKSSMGKVPTLHLPNNKSLIEKALKDKDFMVNSKSSPNEYFYPC